MKKLLDYMFFIITICLVNISAANANKPENATDVYNTLPSDFIKKHQASEYWIAYQVPAAKKTRSLCCWKNNKPGKEYGCNLNKDNKFGYGSSSDMPITENITLFTYIKNGVADEMIIVGDHCPVNSDNNTIHWLHDVPEKNSIKWLDTLIQKHDNKEISDNSLYALIHHRDKLALQTLENLAKSQSHSTAENAIFWLGQKVDGYRHLLSLYNELENGEVRKKINFALSQNNHPDSYSLLKRIALNDEDSEQSKDAIFWLSQSNNNEVLSVFEQILKSDNNQDIHEHTVFAISQLKDRRASETLLDVVKQHPSEDIREHALFWLAKHAPQKTKEVVLDILKNNNAESHWTEHAVFTLSQLPSKIAVDSLFAVLDGKYSKSAKKKALFWLSQSNNPTVIERLSQRL